MPTLKEEDKKPSEEDEKYNKAEDSEDKVEKQDDDEEETEEEKKKKKKSKKAIDDEEDEDKIEKTEGENPEEDTASATDANSTLTPGSVINTRQHVLNPQSNIRIGRNASAGSSAGQSPSDVTYSGKSADTEFMKSPLYKKMVSMEKVLTAKLEAVEKSMKDRIADTKKEMEKFYSQPFYKMAGDNIGPESIQKQTISKQIEEGKVRYSN